MGDFGITLDIGTAYPFIEQRVLALFGKDYASTEQAKWLRSLHDTAARVSSSVQCIGMHKPIPFSNIYQPTRLVVNASVSRKDREIFAYQDSVSRSLLQAQLYEEYVIDVSQVLTKKTDSIIFAGPGWGKTTFLHHLFRSALGDANILPVLILLRRDHAVEDLERLVESLEEILKKKGQPKFLLLVDGYDEVPIAERKRVSESLLRYQGLDRGTFILTCRDHYQIIALQADLLRIDRFTKKDKYRFVGSFLKSFGSSLDAVKVVDEFDAQGFSEFLAHPLLLALACIVKTDSSSVQPGSALKLLEQALDVLRYRWDAEKGIKREKLTPLDGKDRLKVLKRMAYTAQSPHLQKSRAEGLAGQQLALMAYNKVDPHQVLLETAQFYGIFVPSDNGWEFVHRTLHDFLAAQFWVETGEFAKLTSFEWTARTAYAACFLHDSTHVIEAALASPDSGPAINEILSNLPPYDKKRVFTAFVEYFSSPGMLAHYTAEDQRVTGKFEHDLVRYIGSSNLDYFVRRCCAQRSPVTNILAGYSLIHLYKRGDVLDFSTYDEAVKAYGSPRFTFTVIGLSQVQLKFLDPRRK